MSFGRHLQTAVGHQSSSLSSWDAPSNSEYLFSLSFFVTFHVPVFSCNLHCHCSCLVLVPVFFPCPCFRQCSCCCSRHVRYCKYAVYTTSYYIVLPRQNLQFGKYLPQTLILSPPFYKSRHVGYSITLLNHRRHMFSLVVSGANY